MARDIVSRNLVEKLPDLDGLAEVSRTSYSLRVTTMADGTEITLPVNVMVGKGTRPRLVLVAGVHGNEYEGVMAQFNLWRTLNPSVVRGSLVMVPVANPPAFRTLSRSNPSDQIDMNRIFPGDAEGSITHRLAYFLFHEVVEGSDMLLSMHGWTVDSTVIPYVECPRQGQVAAVSRAAAFAFGLGYVEPLDWLPGLLVAAANGVGIPAIEPEIGGQGVTIPEWQALYRQGVLNLMRHLGILAGEPEIPSRQLEVRRTTVLAPLGGVLHRLVEAGEAVGPGHLLATITNLNGESVAEVRSSTDGIVAAIRMHAAINPGDQLAVIFRPVDSSDVQRQLWESKTAS